MPDKSNTHIRWRSPNVISICILDLRKWNAQYLCMSRCYIEAGNEMPFRKVNLFIMIVDFYENRWLVLHNAILSYIFTTNDNCNQSLSLSLPTLVNSICLTSAFYAAIMIRSLLIINIITTISHYPLCICYNIDIR